MVGSIAEPVDFLDTQGWSTDSGQFHEVWQVLNPGDDLILGFFVGSGNVYARVSGYQFSTP